ncbi:MAG: MlaD family protein [Bdellovibrionales bacterium]
MRIRFNKFEKVAGMFVGTAILGCLAGTVGIAVKNGWFALKVHYYTQLETADGIHAGTVVQIAGLRVGSVTSVELEDDRKVRVEFEVFDRFKQKIRASSKVQLFRPFILAEKVLEISIGREDEPLLEVGAMIPVTSSYDVMDLLSGKKMTAILASIDRLAESLQIVGSAFADPERMQGLVEMFDRLKPLIENLNTMSVEIVKITSVANEKKRMETIITSLVTLSNELSRAIPAFSKEVPDLGQQLAQIVKNLNVLTTEFKQLTPAISAVAPELPRASRRAIEAMDEMVVVLKALERSFLLRGKANEVREEEGRRPANTSSP